MVVKSYKTSASDKVIKKAVSTVAEDIINFSEHQLQTFQPRDDYRELLELTIMFLGGKSTFSIKTPGALHRSRWMAKSIILRRFGCLENS